MIDSMSSIMVIRSYRPGHNQSAVQRLKIKRLDCFFGVLLLSVPRKPRQRSGNFPFARSDYDAAVIPLPRSGREDYFTRYRALFDYRSHQNIVPQHKLIAYLLISFFRKHIGQMPHDRFTRCCGGLGQSRDFLSHSAVQMRRSNAMLQMRLIQHLHGAVENCIIGNNAEHCA